MCVLHAPPVEAKRRSRYRGPVASENGTGVAPEDGTGVPFLALLNAFVFLFNRGAAMSNFKLNAIKEIPLCVKPSEVLVSPFLFFTN